MNFQEFPGLRNSLRAIKNAKCIVSKTELALTLCGMPRNCVG